MSEINIPGDLGERICRYPNEPIPERYAMFNVEGMPTRVKSPRVRRAWAVVASIADHKTLITLAALRRLERSTRAPTSNVNAVLSCLKSVKTKLAKMFDSRKPPFLACTYV